PAVRRLQAPAGDRPDRPGAEPDARPPGRGRPRTAPGWPQAAGGTGQGPLRRAGLPPRPGQGLRDGACVPSRGEDAGPGAGGAGGGGAAVAEGVECGDGRRGAEGRAGGGGAEPGGVPQPAGAGGGGPQGLGQGGAARRGDGGPVREARQGAAAFVEGG